MSARMVDLAGVRFGRLTAVEPDGKSRGRITWFCRCDCGESKSVVSSRLTQGITKSCGCLLRNDLSGQRFGRLVAVSYSHTRRAKCMWRCKCDCGNETMVISGQLASNQTQSCGCLVREISARRLTGGAIRPPMKRGGASVTHRAEFMAWLDMKRRCTSQSSVSFAGYGGRGIDVCSRWMESFDNFIQDMGSRPSGGYSIDRIDNDRGYSPDNCRWATRTAQMRNQRRNLVITIDGESKCATEWGEVAGVNPALVTYRINHGWSPRDAVFTPPRPRAPSRSYPTEELERELARRMAVLP